MNKMNSTDLKIVELYKDSIRECVEDGQYQEALDSFRLVMQDCSDLGFEIYWDMVGFWQECYDMTINLPNHPRRVISFVPKRAHEKDEKNEETFE
jgi:hypothetical protein